MSTAADPQFEALLEPAPDAIVIVDDEGRISVVNRQAEDMFGYRREELLGQPVEVLVPERFTRHSEQRAAFVARPGTRPMVSGLEFFAKRKDGTEFPVDISLGPLETSDGRRIVSIIRDLSDRKRVEGQLRGATFELESANVELRRSADRFRELLESAPDSIVIVGSAGRISIVNRQVE
jgi:PAS domain S-box-containing protein